MQTTPVLLTPVVTAREAAELLGVTRQTIARWVNEGYMLPAKRLPGAHGAALFTTDEVDRVRATPRPRKAYTRRGEAA